MPYKLRNKPAINFQKQTIKLLTGEIMKKGCKIEAIFVFGFLRKLSKVGILIIR